MKMMRKIENNEKEEKSKLEEPIKQIVKKQRKQKKV